MSAPQPWLRSARYDGWLILAPPFGTLAVVALVWSRRPAGALGRGWWAGRHGLALFLGAIALFAFLEEGLWDGLVWREHGAVFGWFQQLPAVAGPGALMWLVPLLALPQSTHYVLDGFIWRRAGQP